MAEAAKVDEEKEKYCEPWCAGLLSEPRAVGRRIGKLLDSLDMVNRHVCKGEITDDAEDFRAKLLEKLRAEGWRITAGDTRWKVLPPK